MSKNKISLLFFILLFISSCANQQIESYETREYNEPIQVFFCPQDDCIGNLIKFINSSNKYVHCALFDIGLEELADILNEKNALVVIDNTNTVHLEKINKTINNLKIDTSWQLSHNKFCIIDGKAVWTGSFNPTERGNFKNNNNALLIYSKQLAENYENEFQELWNGNFGRGEETENKIIHYNNVKIENYFCPEDWCANRVMEALNKANKSIYFMTFSFTHSAIGDLLVKKINKGVEAKGVFEKSQRNRWTQFDKLLNASADVKWDNNSANMHHKVFIIDEEIVITGSFNPSISGDTKNDENVLIIHDKEIAEKYLEEFESVYG